VEISFDDPINKKCPLTGKDIVAGRTVEYEKQTIGFCCADCVGKFESDPKKYIGKVKEFKKKSSLACCCDEAKEIAFVSPDGDPINKVCPLTGKDVNPTKVVEYEGLSPQEALKKFTSDPVNFRNTLKQLAASVSRSAETVAL
jgi:hypothetical protein